MNKILTMDIYAMNVLNNDIGYIRALYSAITLVLGVRVYIYLSCLYLSVRKWKVKGTFGGAGKWEFEVGEDLGPPSLDAAGFTESSSNVSTKWCHFNPQKNWVFF